MKKNLILIGILALLLTGCGDDNTVTGRIDTAVQSHYSTVSAQVLEVPVALGQTVKAGDVLLVLDDSSAQYSLEQAKQTLSKAQYALAQASEAVEPENVQQSRNQVTIAEQNVNNAKAAYDKAESKYQKQLVLYEAGAIPQQTLDDVAYQRDVAQAAVVTAEAQLDTARQQLALIQKQQNVSNQVKMAESDVKQAENQVAQLTDQLDEYVIRAACDGVVLSLSYREGAMLTAGSLVADVSVDGETYWIGYVPEEDAGRLSYGQQVVIKADGVEEAAELCYLDIKTQYAPEEFQRASSNDRKTVKVKCRLSADSALTPGQEADMQYEVTE